MTVDFTAYGRATPSAPTHRLVPSQYPPINAFETVASPDDLEAVMELEGWTNDRLSATRLAQIDRADWVYGRPNASVVMAAFLHGSPGGLRFTDADLGAWYGSSALETAILEVANGMRQEIALKRWARLTRTYRAYRAEQQGDHLDIVGLHPEFHDPDPASYPEPQRFGADVRLHGPAHGVVGIRYESVRHAGHHNWVTFRPSLVANVMQSGHYEIDVPKTGKVTVRTRG